MLIIPMYKTKEWSDPYKPDCIGDLPSPAEVEQSAKRQWEEMQGLIDAFLVNKK